MKSNLHKMQLPAYSNKKSPTSKLFVAKTPLPIKKDEASNHEIFEMMINEL